MVLTPTDLDEPDLQVAGLRLWIHGRQYSDANDYDDGNWLRVTANCSASGSSVWAQDAILTVRDIAWLGRECTTKLCGKASNHPMQWTRDKAQRSGGSSGRQAVSGVVRRTECVDTWH